MSGAPIFSFVRVERAQDLLPESRHAVDVALLDMNFGFPNIGHDSIVAAVRSAAGRLASPLSAAGLTVRLFSFDVRRRLQMPGGAARFRLHLGSGGPGHLDPRMNDGVRPESQGVAEDPAWEPRLFRLFEEILRRPETALLAVCHTFGLLCRFSGIAQPVLRTSARGGPSKGIRDNALTPDAARHPWFSDFASQLPDGRHFRVVDSRLFDLIPDTGRLPAGVLILAHESRSPKGPEERALTMVEFARETGVDVPRVLAVNHHPEVAEPANQRELIDGLLARGEVSRQWHNERAAVLNRFYSDREDERNVRATARYTLLAPLEFHLRRAAGLSPAAECGSAASDAIPAVP